MTAPQPPAEAQRCTCPSGDGSLRWPCPAHPAEVQEVVCLECGQPTMHMGQVCYACSHPAEKPAEAHAQGGGEAGILRGAAKYHYAQAACQRDQFGNTSNHRNPTVEAWHRQVADAITAIAAPPSAPVGVEAIKSAIAELDALRNAMFKTYAAAANGADKAKLTRLIEAERDAYESHYSLPKLQEALAQQPATPIGEAVATVSGEFSEVRQDGEVYWLQTVLLKRPQQLPFGAPLYTAPQQPAAVECPHRTRCDCLVACKYGFAGDGALAAQPGGSDNDR